MDNFRIATLSDDVAAHNLWLQNVWIPYDTFNKVPANCKDFILSMGTDTMPGFTPYHNKLELFDDPNFPINMINSFPDIANPTKDVIVKGVQALIPNQSAQLRDASFNILKDYYAQVLITVYYSQPDVISITDVGARLKKAVTIAFANYQSALSQWNDREANQNKSWILNALGSVLRIIPFVGSTLAEVFTGITGSLNNVKLTTPSGQTLQLGQNGLAVDLSGQSGTLQTILWIGLGGGLLYILFSGKKKTTRKK
jgi:hypothetical protein